jgi:hypothetical protein
MDVAPPIKLSFHIAVPDLDQFTRIGLHRTLFRSTDDRTTATRGLEVDQHWLRGERRACSPCLSVSGYVGLNWSAWLYGNPHTASAERHRPRCP